MFITHSAYVHYRAIDRFSRAPMWWRLSQPHTEPHTMGTFLNSARLVEACQRVANSCLASAAQIDHRSVGGHTPAALRQARGTGSEHAKRASEFRRANAAYVGNV